MAASLACSKEPEFFVGGWGVYLGGRPNPEGIVTVKLTGVGIWLPAAVNRGWGREGLINPRRSERGRSDRVCVEKKMELQYLFVWGGARVKLGCWTWTKGGGGGRGF